MQIPLVAEKNPATMETIDSGPGPTGHLTKFVIYQGNSL